MQNVEMWRPAVWSGQAGCIAVPQVPAFSTQMAHECGKNSQFVGMLNAFRSSGGLARVQEVAGRFKSQSASDVSPLAELVLVHDDWEVTTWFTQPNHWLASTTPANSMAVATRKVFHGARAERFVVAG